MAVFYVYGFGGVSFTPTTIFNSIYTKFCVRPSIGTWREVGTVGRNWQLDVFKLDPAQIPWNDTWNDAAVRNLVAILNTYDDTDTIILMGHSFGADTVLETAAATSRQIDLLVTLDAIDVGSIGQRSLVPVNSNVRYLYNRWQTVDPFPSNQIPIIGGLFGGASSGQLPSSAVWSDQAVFNGSEGNQHVGIAYASFIQDQISWLINNLHFPLPPWLGQWRS